MNAVAKIESQEPTSILALIQRAAQDPACDIDKMERLLQMKERMDARNAETAFNQALSSAQADIGRIAADATNPQTRSKYATYAKLDSILRPVYTRHGFALSFDETDSPKPDHIRVLCHLTHSAGHRQTFQKDMPNDGKGAKGGDVMTKTHAAGAALSYGMRYLLKGIFNVAIGEEDTDGNDPREPTLNERQVADLDCLLDSTGANKAQFLKWAKVTRLDEIPAKNFDSVCREVQERARTRATK
jgi:hypothetical protein